MFTTRENVFERIEQSFGILKSNFFKLFLPVFFYNFITLFVFWIFVYATYKYFFLDFNINEFDILTILNNSYFILYFILGLICFLGFLLLNIPVIIMSIKSINQTCNENEVNIKENLIFGFSRILLSFKTYWYIFAYVALIPSVLFISGGLLYIMGFFSKGLSVFNIISVVIMGFSSIFFIIFIIYRGFKTKFSIYLAVDNDEYTKNTFNKSVKITDNNWYRIVGNYILIGIFISLISQLISGFFPSPFDLSNMYDYDSIESIYELYNNFSLSSFLISGFCNNIMNSVFSIYMIIFTYVFYKRLVFEFDGNKDVNNEIKKDNLEVNDIEL